MNKDRFKFRIWFPQSKELIYYPNEHLSLDQIEEIIDDENAEEIIMQCIGIKDVNDKFIYEGDLFKHYCEDDDTFRLLSCNYCESKCGFELYQYCTNDSIFAYIDDFDCSYESGAEFATLEVVGNIFENPELIKADKEV